MSGSASFQTLAVRPHNSYDMNIRNAELSSIAPETT